MESELIEADENDVAADPEHRERTDDRQCLEDDRHGLDQAFTELLRGLRRPLRHGETDVVELHDEANHAVDECRDRHCDDCQHSETRPERLVGNLLEGDHHDFGGEDEVGADRADDHLLLMVRTLLDHRLFLLWVVAGDPLDELLRPLEREIGAAEHQKGREQPRNELAEQHREDDDDCLVQQRALGDLPDDRQLASRREPLDILRGDCSIVDDDGSRLGASASCSCADVINGCSRDLCDRCDVIQQSGEASGHGDPLSRSAGLRLGPHRRDT